MIRSILLTCLLAASVLANPPEAPKAAAEPARFACELQKKDDTFSIEGKPEAPEFRIHSQSGIGSAKVIRRHGKWPQTVVVRFDKMRMLESFVAKIGKAEIRGDLKGANQAIHFDKDGKKLDKAEGSAFSLQIVEMQTERSIEVRIVLPEPAYEAIELHWIDAFR
jgi:hypothetical protein